MIVLGIVGAMGSGKTVVLEILGELGAAIIRADDLSRELLTPVSDTTQAVRVEFGEDFFDANGHLLRGKLAALIFSSEDARGRLNAIIYPAMLGLLRRQLEQICNRHCSPALVAVEAANLHEMGGDRLMDRVLRVTAPMQVRQERIQLRDGLSVQEAQVRLASHTAAGLDQGAADYELPTDKPITQLRADVQRLYQSLISSECAT